MDTFHIKAFYLFLFGKINCILKQVLCYSGLKALLLKFLIKNKTKSIKIHHFKDKIINQDTIKKEKKPVVTRGLNAGLPND